jgi:hypothetical protein
MRAFLAALMLCAIAAPAAASWQPRYAQAPQAVQDWYRGAQLTDAAAKRLKLKGCCDESEVVRTKFQVRSDDGADEWFYVDPKDGKTKQVPPDIIHWGESAPDGQPTLFVISDYWADVFHLPHGTPTCFYPGESGQ